MNLPYRVELDLFTGPLDLLLYLVRRNEVDIVDLPIAKITRQFQEFLDVLRELDLDLIGDFVVMASTLIEIKSRNVLPSTDEEVTQSATSTDRGDPRSDLVQQLLEYRKFKEAAQALERHAAIWQERYPRLTDERPRSGKDPSADRIKEVELWDLVSALGRILKRKEIETQSAIRYDETPIQTYVERIGELVRLQREVPFHSLFADEPSRSRIIGMFLAVLELIRHHQFRAIQSSEFGEIIILPPEEPIERHPDESVPADEIVPDTPPESIE